MTTIQPHAPHATLVNVFTVAPEKADALVELLVRATDEVMRYVPGFVSANIHVSTDGTRVVNYGQWADAEAFAAMTKNPQAREHMDRAADLAESFDPHLYTVVSVHQAG
ncbi:MAG: hypothetical protein QOH57_3730 [Mycobacterium sp.]|jgi:quinol monooxygenase YgiN|nr:hypothetical protein [Mycobacterium sp.]